MTRRPNTGLKHDQATHADYWEGSGEELVEAGVVERHMLPGQPGRNKTCVTFNGVKGRPGGPGYLQIRRTGKDRFQVTKWADLKEQARRESQRELQEGQRLLQEKRRWAEQEIDRFPKSALGYRKLVAESIDFSLNLVRSYFGSGFRSGGYFFDSDAVSEMEELVKEIRSISEMGCVLFSDEVLSLQKDRAFIGLGLEPPGENSRPKLRLVKM